MPEPENPEDNSQPGDYIQISEEGDVNNVQ